MYPSNEIIRERYAVNANEPPCGETELPTDLRQELRLILIAKGDGPRGPALRPVSASASAEILAGTFLGSLQPYLTGLGSMVAKETNSTRGAAIVPLVPVGCDTELGGIVNGQLTNEDATRIIEYARGSAFPLGSGPRGAALAFRATGPCPNIESAPDEFGGAFYQYDVNRGPYPVDIFGSRCSMCPIVFASYDRPCLDCSYKPEHVNSSHPNVAGAQCKGLPGAGHRRFAFDWETREMRDFGKAHCVPNYFNDKLFPNIFDPDFRMTCHIDPDTGAPQEHHCEECVYERCIGLIVNTILSSSDALNKVPLRAVRAAEGEQQGDHCKYGCGEFGFELWDRGTGLRIPNFLEPGDILTAREEPTANCITIGDEPACLASFNRGTGPGGPFELRWQSGFPFCGTALRCDCGDNIFCTTTHAFEWDSESLVNKITDAWLCIKQHELCNPIDPCPENPIQSEDCYNCPSSELIAWVDCGYTLTLKIKHWGPNPSNLRQCGCCFFFNEFEADELTVTIKARFTGPVAWGNRGTGFNGYLLDGLRLYPESFPDIPAASYPGVAGNNGCANLFVDQGSYNDPLALPPPFGDAEYEPRKRCPSWFADDGSAKFFCPPWNQMTWEINGSRSNDWEDTSSIQPNKHERRRQCWAGQVIRNDGSGCSDGSIDARSIFDTGTGCQDPECRRGCSMNESFQSDGSHLSPWPESNGRATPGGCSQCGVAYPPEPML